MSLIGIPTLCLIINPTLVRSNLLIWQKINIIEVVFYIL